MRFMFLHRQGFLFDSVEEHRCRDVGDAVLEKCSGKGINVYDN